MVFCQKPYSVALPPRDELHEGNHRTWEIPVPKGSVQCVSDADTWFEKYKLRPERVLGICYSFATDAGYELPRREAYDEATGTLLSQETVRDWYNYCREIITADFTLLQEQTGQIGGPGRIVQVDESKSRRRKYNCGRRVEEDWVLGLIEDDSEDFRMVLCSDNRRGAEDLIPIIQQHVAAGTEIHTDSWRSYRGLIDCGSSEPNGSFNTDLGNIRYRDLNDASVTCVKCIEASIS